MITRIYEGYNITTSDVKTDPSHNALPYLDNKCNEIRKIINKYIRNNAFTCKDNISGYKISFENPIVDIGDFTEYLKNNNLTIEKNENKKIFYISYKNSDFSKMLRGLRAQPLS